MVSFIDAHRGTHGIEPICKLLPIAPSKAEVIHQRGPWRSFEAVEYATLEWVDWFNHRRLLEPIGSIPPADAKANHHAALEQSEMAPWP